ncbi:hypothetical protein N9K16_04225 [Alphaproteobacteria bacterium]|nr:hypothetical protein [Alphaproteobacteria bacterium]
MSANSLGRSIPAIKLAEAGGDFYDEMQWHIHYVRRGGIPSFCCFSCGHCALGRSRKTNGATALANGWRSAKILFEAI